MCSLNICKNNILNHMAAASHKQIYFAHQYETDIIIVSGRFILQNKNNLNIYFYIASQKV